MPAITAMGMRSCTNGMLLWASKILDSERDNLAVNKPWPLSNYSPSILHKMGRIRKGQWTRPSSSKKPLTSDTVYCTGWYKTTIPTPMLGVLSYNDMKRDESD